MSRKFNIETVDNAVFSADAYMRLLRVTYTTTGTCQITLPEKDSTNVLEGLYHYILDVAGNAGTNNITIIPFPGDGTTINGGASFTMNANNQGIQVTLLPDNNWYITWNSVSGGGVSTQESSLTYIDPFEIDFESNLGTVTPIYQPRYAQINLVNSSTAVTTSIFRDFLGLHRDWEGLTYGRLTIHHYTPSGRGTTGYRLLENGIVIATNLNLSETDNCKMFEIDTTISTCPKLQLQCVAVPASPPKGLSFSIEAVRVP